MMQNVLQCKTRVLPGGKIEVTNQELPVGAEVDVIVIFPTSTPPSRSAVDILVETPGHRLFKTTADVDDYLQKEREAWDC
jgi:hypothetical protein